MSLERLTIGLEAVTMPELEQARDTVGVLIHKSMAAICDNAVNATPDPTFLSPTGVALIALSIAIAGPELLGVIESVRHL
jgi:hypothetical protein